MADIGTARSLPFVERIRAAARETMPHAVVEPVGQWWLAQQGMNRLSRDVMLSAVTALVSLCIVFIAANTASMAVRERAGEIGVLRAIGFRRRVIFAMLLAETVVLATSAGAVGVGLAFVVTKSLERLGGSISALGPLGGFIVTPGVMVQGLALSLAIGIFAGFAPAYGAARRPVADTLRERSRLFGEGLQLVNILKDSITDESEGRVYVSASQREEAMALAQADLQAAAEYTLALQRQGAEHGLVAFNALLVRLALGTLAVLRERGPGAKLSRRVKGRIRHTQRPKDFAPAKRVQGFTRYALERDAQKDESDVAVFCARPGIGR